MPFRGGLVAKQRQTTCARPPAEIDEPVDSLERQSFARRRELHFQGLVRHDRIRDWSGQFNDIVADFALKPLAALPGKPHVWAVGERIVTKNFRVQPGKKVDLSSRPTTVRPLFKSKKQYHHMLDSHVSQMPETIRFGRCRWNRGAPNRARAPGEWPESTSQQRKDVGRAPAECLRLVQAMCQLRTLRADLQGDLYWSTN